MIYVVCAKVREPNGAEYFRTVGEDGLKAMKELEEEKQILIYHIFKQEDDLNKTS